MIYCVSDLHGKISPVEFEDFLRKCGFSSNDYLFLLGDLIDRHEYGVELLKWLLLQPNAQLILGNHEAMLLSCKFIFNEITDASLAEFNSEKMELLSNWLSNGAEPTLKALKKLRNEDPDFCSEILEYLEEAPLYETVSVGGNQDFLLCHAGFDYFDPSRKLSSYSSDEWLWSRPKIDSTYFDDITTIFGHTSTEYYGPERKGKILHTPTWIDIDVGCERIALLRLDDMAEFYLDIDT